MSSPLVRALAGSTLLGSVTTLVTIEHKRQLILNDPLYINSMYSLTKYFFSPWIKDNIFKPWLYIPDHITQDDWIKFMNDGYDVLSSSSNIPDGMLSDDLYLQYLNTHPSDNLINRINKNLLSTDICAKLIAAHYNLVSMINTDIKESLSYDQWHYIIKNSCRLEFQTIPEIYRDEQLVLSYAKHFYDKNLLNNNTDIQDILTHDFYIKLITVNPKYLVWQYTNNISYDEWKHIIENSNEHIPIQRIPSKYLNDEMRTHYAKYLTDPDFFDSLPPHLLTTNFCINIYNLNNDYVVYIPLDILVSILDDIPKINRDTQIKLFKQLGYANYHIGTVIPASVLSKLFPDLTFVKYTHYDELHRDMSYHDKWNTDFQRFDPFNLNTGIHFTFKQSNEWRYGTWERRVDFNDDELIHIMNGNRAKCHSIYLHPRKRIECDE